MGDQADRQLHGGIRGTGVSGPGHGVTERAPVAPVVHNERLKLTASSIDRLATASIAAGFITPVVSLANGQILFGLSAPLAISTMTWLFTALASHLAARHLLGKLKP
jgi:hypothetical protein